MPKIKRTRLSIAPLRVVPILLLCPLSPAATKASQPGNNAPTQTPDATPNSKADADHGEIPFNVEFEVSSSFDGRYRIKATRLEKYEDIQEGPSSMEVGLNHGYFRLRLEDQVTGKPVSFATHVFLYYGALRRESIKEAFVWHPTRDVLIWTIQSARHWKTYQVLEFKSGQTRIVPVANEHSPQNPDRETDSEIDFRGFGLDYAAKAAEPVYIGMSPPDPLPEEWGAIERMHSYGQFERWEKDEIVFRVDLNVWKTNRKLESVGGTRNADGKIGRIVLEGRLQLVAETPKMPAHLTLGEIKFRKPLRK